MAANPTATEPATLTFIVTCKGRLHHLQQSLPILAQQQNTQCIVVDYSCPQGTGDWVAAHFPEVQVVRVADQPHFHASHARNVGAHAAASTWICFLDADTLLDAEFLPEIMPLLSGRNYFQATPFTAELCGLLICRLQDFHAAGGYDEVFQGWGCEDNDLPLRLGFLNCQRVTFPSRLADFIAHDDSERMRFHEVNDRWLSLRINGMYLQIKTDMARQLGVVQLPPQQRQELYNKVRETILANPAQSAQIEITFSSPRLDFKRPPNWRFNRIWIYRFEPEDPLSMSPVDISSVSI